MSSDRKPRRRKAARKRQYTNKERFTRAFNEASFPREHLIRELDSSQEEFIHIHGEELDWNRLRKMITFLQMLPYMDFLILYLFYIENLTNQEIKEATRAEYVEGVKKYTESGLLRCMQLARPLSILSLKKALLRTHADETNEFVFKGVFTDVSPDERDRIVAEYSRPRKSVNRDQTRPCFSDMDLIDRLTAFIVILPYEDYRILALFYAMSYNYKKIQYMPGQEGHGSIYRIRGTIEYLKSRLLLCMKLYRPIPEIYWKMALKKSMDYYNFEGMKPDNKNE